MPLFDRALFFFPYFLPLIKLMYGTNKIWLFTLMFSVSLWLIHKMKNKIGQIYIFSTLLLHTKQRCVRVVMAVTMLDMWMINTHQKHDEIKGLGWEVNFDVPFVLKYLSRHLCIKKHFNCVRWVGWYYSDSIL